MSQEEFVNRLKTANAKAVLIIMKEGRAVVKFYINNPRRTESTPPVIKKNLPSNILILI